MMLRLLIFAWLLPLIGFASAPAHSAEKRIAISFDDAPLPDGPLFTGTERAERILAGLKGAGVEQAAFFVTTGNIDRPEDDARVRRYAVAGHLIANHSHTHKWLSRVTSDDYIADIDRAERELRRFPNRRSWFRFPFLNESPDLAKRDAVRAALAKRGLANGYVTVDTWDWALVNLIASAKKAGREIDMNALRDLYLETMLSAVDTYEGLAQEALGRSPVHVLLAHENDLQALFIADLVAALRKRGWTIVSPDTAYQDPIARTEPDTLHNGNGRVAALAAVKGISPARLRNPFHDEELLKKQFEERVVRKAGAK